MGIGITAEVPPRNGTGRDSSPSLLKVSLLPSDSPGTDSGTARGEALGDTESRRGKETLLRSTPLFANLPPGVLSRIVDRSVWREHRRRQAIHFPGDPADAVCVVRQGRVKLSR